LQLPIASSSSPLTRSNVYDNPAPDLDYGPDAACRVMWGHLQPLGSTEPAEPGRRLVVTRWRMFTIEPVTASERIEWRGRVLDIEGEPDRFEPRFGLVHYETRLRHVEG
jgi:hypothetical protein